MKEKKNETKKIYTNPDSFMRNMVLYTPGRLKKKLSSFEVKVMGSFAIIYYVAAIMFAVIFSLAFELDWQMWVCTIAFAIFMAPIIFVEYVKDKNERKKFSDINSYCQQFISGMQLKHKIIPAIENTIFTFPTGRMNTVLLRALTYIQNSKNPIAAQSEALFYIDNEYPNSQTPMIHDFAKRIELSGGDFENEMNLLDKKREKWEKRVEHEQNQTKTSLIGSVIMYIAMMAVCIVVVQGMPESLVIKNFTSVKIGEMLLIMMAYPFVYSCVKNHRKGWMNGENNMDEKESAKKLNYLDNYDPKKERKKGLLAGTISVTLTIIGFLLTRNLYIVLGGLVVSVVAFNIHDIIKLKVAKQVRKEMTRSLPKWLFDVCLCMQKTNIVEAIERSKRTAAPILRKDIEKFLSELNKNPEDITPYLEFLSSYEVPNINATMRALLSIQHGTGGNSGMQMQQLISHNLNLLDEQDAAEEEIRRMATLKYSVTASIPASIVMVIYLFSVMIKVFDTMAGLI